MHGYTSSMEKFSDQLRQAIRDSARSRYAISKQTGVDQAVLSKFASKKGGLSLKAIDELMDCLDLEIRSRDQEGRRNG
jgi:hypothetical protein